MTMELLCQIMEENNIPRDVHFLSDSGWECDPTEMDGVYYDRENNTMYFTQGGDQNYEGFETLYTPDLIKIGDINVFPAASIHGIGLDDRFKTEIKTAGEFESYYGIRETDEIYDQIRLRKPLFYCIKIKESFVGYVGFNGDENELEPEIYIFKQYRNKGYGSRVLKKFVDMAFKDGLLKENKKEIIPKKLVSTVRVENENSRRMMEACGFIENNEAAAIFRGVISEDGEVFDPVEVKEYYLTKEHFSRQYVVENAKLIWDRGNK